MRRTGLFFGKLLPPHLGHLSMAHALRDRVDEVIVLCLASLSEPISLEDRLAWLREALPWATVLGGHDEAPMGDTEELWQAHLEAIVSALDGREVDLLLTNEWYGEETARRLGCDHLQLDPSREVLPVSATGVREDVDRWWWLTPAPVRQALARRVVIVGAESTGSTTLSRALAEHLGTVWVPEYGRAYSAAKGPSSEWQWALEEFPAIAREQDLMEDAGSRLSGPTLVCDTDSLATLVWQQHLCGTTSAHMRQMASMRRPAAYVLTSPEGVEWEDDGLREGSHRRAAMHESFREELAAQAAPWIEVIGSPEERLAAVVGWLEGLPRAWDQWVQRSRETVELWRPCGPLELELVAASGFQAWPPRLPDQPIFYPVMTEAYAERIAREWNAPVSGVGFVTRFSVRRSFVDRFAVQVAGGGEHTELWIPAEELEELNANIVGAIEVVSEWRE